jgi:hypothetical protein
LCIFFSLFFWPLTPQKTQNKKQLNPNDLLVAAASPYGLIGYHNGSSPTETAAAMEPSASRTGLLSTVTDTTSSPSSANAVHQPVNRLGNLDWLIHSLNTNLPDPAALIRQPNLTPNLKHMIQGGGNNNNNSTATTTNTTSVHQRSPQHVAHQGKSPLNNRHHSFSSSLPARANFVPVTGMASNSTNTNNKFPKSSVSPAF